MHVSCCEYAQSYMHAKEKAWEDAKLSPLFDLEAPCKEGVRAKAELSASGLIVECIPQHAHRALWQRLGVLLIPGD